MCCPPTFSGVDVFCTNAQGIYSIIGAIFVKFSQLILMKIIKIVATRCQVLRLKCAKFNDSALPDLLAGFKGPTSKGMGGKGGSRRRGGVPFTFFCGSTPMPQRNGRTRNIWKKDLEKKIWTASSTTGARLSQQLNMESSGLRSTRQSRPTVSPTLLMFAGIHTAQNFVFCFHSGNKP